VTPGARREMGRDAEVKASPSERGVARARECTANAPVYDTENFQIGYRAFLAKTTPRFIGR